jgi:hypothetical protein
MGGFGSGRQGWLPTIEDGLKLDLRRLRQQGLFDGKSGYRSMNLTWNNTYTGEKTASAGLSYSTMPGNSWLALEYTITRDGERIPVKDTFHLERLEQPFGGYRWYLRCPQTGRCCQCLYLPPGATHFRSRQGFRCRLQYRSQHHGPYDRLLDRRERIAAKVLRAGPPEWRDKYRDWGIAPKPKGMRWATYELLFEEWENYENQVNAYLAVFVARLGGL